MVSARPSSPFSRAMVARVLLFGLYGLYKSSTSTSVMASSMDFFNSGVSFPWEFMLSRTVFFLSSRFLRYFNLSSNFLKTSSSSEPVASFLYLAMKGMVFPSSISLITLSACDFFIFSSLDNSSEIITLLAPGLIIPLQKDFSSWHFLLQFFHSCNF